MDDLEKILSLAERSTGGIESTGNIITQIYRQYIAKYSAADQYLNDVIKEKGKPSAKDSFPGGWQRPSMPKRFMD